MLPGYDSQESEYSHPGANLPCVCGCGKPRVIGARRGRFERLYATDACRARMRNRRIAEALDAAREFKARQRALPGESRVERAYREWIASEDGQVVRDEVIRRARLALAQGILRWGIKGIWEAIRWDNRLALKAEAGAWKLNNSFPSLLARDVMAEVPELRTFFKTRGLRGVR